MPTTTETAVTKETATEPILNAKGAIRVIKCAQVKAIQASARNLVDARIRRCLAITLDPNKRTFAEHYIISRLDLF